MQLLQEVSERLRKNAGAVKTIAVDGKTLRGSAKGGKSIHVLNAWASGARLSIGQLAVESKSNEITHVPQLLQSLDLKGCIVTADALNTQVSTIQTIVQGKGDYVLPLKANHPTHQSVVSAIMRDIATTREPDFEQVEKGHGRLETRRCWVTSDLSLFLEKDKWPKLRTLVRIDRARRLTDGRETTETALFLSSLPADAPTIANAVRQHWGVENQCHWCLDVVFREDACRARLRNAARNLSALRADQAEIMANGIRAEYAKRAEANTIRQDDLFGFDETFNTEMALRAKYAGDQLARINLDLRALKIVSGKQSGNVAAKDSLLKKYNVLLPFDF